MTEAHLQKRVKSEAQKLTQEFTVEGIEEHARHFAIVCCTKIMNVGITGGVNYNFYERVREELINPK